MESVLEDRVGDIESNLLPQADIPRLLETTIEAVYQLLHEVLKGVPGMDSTELDREADVEEKSNRWEALLAMARRFAISQYPLLREELPGRSLNWQLLDWRQT